MMNFNLNPYDSHKADDPKPELSIKTLQINMEQAHKRVMAAQQAYSIAYMDWLQWGERIKALLDQQSRGNPNA